MKSLVESINFIQSINEAVVKEFVVIFDHFSPENGYIVVNPSKKLLEIGNDFGDYYVFNFKKGKDYKGNVVILSINDESCDIYDNNWHSPADFARDLKKEIKDFLDGLTDKDWDEIEDYGYFEIETNSLPWLTFNLEDMKLNRHNFTVDKIYDLYINWMNNTYIDGDSSRCYFMVDLDKQKILDGCSEYFGFCDNKEIEDLFYNPENFEN